MRVTFP